MDSPAAGKGDPMNPRDLQEGDILRFGPMDDEDGFLARIHRPVNRFGTIRMKRITGSAIEQHWMWMNVRELVQEDWEKVPDGPE